MVSQGGEAREKRGREEGKGKKREAITRGVAFHAPALGTAPPPAWERGFQGSCRGGHHRNQCLQDTSVDVLPPSLRFLSTSRCQLFLLHLSNAFILSIILTILFLSRLSSSSASTISSSTTTYPSSSSISHRPPYQLNNSTYNPGTAIQASLVRRSLLGPTTIAITAHQFVRHGHKRQTAPHLHVRHLGRFSIPFLSLRRQASPALQLQMAPCEAIPKHHASVPDTLDTIESMPGSLRRPAGWCLNSLA
ncbi:hypothetical protein V8C26DRAFT_52464 [Trichoderma gracile]